MKFCDVSKLSLRTKERWLERAALILANIDAGELPELRSAIYEIGYELERVEQIRAKERQRARELKHQSQKKLEQEFSVPYV